MSNKDKTKKVIKENCEQCLWACTKNGVFFCDLQDCYCEVCVKTCPDLKEQELEVS